MSSSLHKIRVQFCSVQFSSVAQSCLTLCDPMNRSTPGLPVHHQLLEFTQTHVRRVCDAIQPSHPLSSPSPPAPNPSQLLRLQSVPFIPAFVPKLTQRVGERVSLLGMGVGMGETYDELSRCAPTSGETDISYKETHV